MRSTGDVRYWRDPDLKGMETCLVRESCHVFPKHTHDGIYAIAMMEAGGSYCLGPGKRDSLVLPGKIGLVNPNQVHSGVPFERMRVTYRMLYIDEAQMSDMAADIAEREDMVPEFQQTVAGNRTLFEVLKRVCCLMIRGGDRMEKESAVLNSVAGLLSGYCDGRESTVRCEGQNRLIRRAQEFLAENLDQKLSLDEAAAAAGLSRYHFLRLFKKATGVPPHVFRTQRRIDRAKQLLKRGMPFAQVALETGFVDQSHFSNKFKQFTGATPSQYVSLDCSKKSNFLQYTSEPPR